MKDKSTYSPESYGKRVNEWMWSAEEGTSAHSFPKRAAEEVAQRRIGDAERVVLTLLADVQSIPPLLAYWLHEFQSPAFHLDLWDYLRQPMPILAASVLRHLTDQGYHWNQEHTEEHIQELLERGYGIKDGALTYPADAETPEWRRDTYQAIFELASALVVHREQGEEGEDTYTAAGPFTLTTSLAAALVDYHKAVTGVLKDRLAGRYPQE